MSIEIVKPGILSTLVGDERRGFRMIGVGGSGPLDAFAMQAANFLVGNEAVAAVVEFHLPGPVISVLDDLVLASAGSGFEWQADGRNIPPWRAVKVKAGTTLTAVATGAGGIGYLAVHGGWIATEWLGSVTTSLAAGAGGREGRALRKGDHLHTSDTQRTITTNDFSWGLAQSQLDVVYAPPHEIRCIAGIEASYLSTDAYAQFTSQPFTITAQRNRMGYRLAGPSLHLRRPLELVSSPVDAGVVQFLPDGQLIVLMADSQTTGGYPRIASVVKADLPRLAQRSTGDAVFFKMISITDAEAMLLSRSRHLAEIKARCLRRLSQ